MFKTMVNIILRRYTQISTRDTMLCGLTLLLIAELVKLLQIFYLQPLLRTAVYDRLQTKCVKRTLSVFRPNKYKQSTRTGEEIRYRCAHDAELEGRVSTVDRGRVLPFLKTSVETESVLKNGFTSLKSQASLCITFYW